MKRAQSPNAKMKTVRISPPFAPDDMNTSRGRESKPRARQSLGIAGLDMGTGAELDFLVSRFSAVGGLCKPISAFCVNMDHAWAMAIMLKRTLWITNTEKKRKPTNATRFMSAARNLANRVRTLWPHWGHSPAEVSGSKTAPQCQHVASITAVYTTVVRTLPPHSGLLQAR